MEVTFLTYCSKEYLKSAKQLIKSVKQFSDIKKYALYTRKDLVNSKFYLDNKLILDEPEGAGCFLWKIYYLHKEYFKLKQGEILFYADAGSKIISDIKPLINLCYHENIVLFNLNNNPKNKAWCKRDTFVYMNCDNENYYDATQYNAAFQIYKRCKKNDEFLNELLEYGKNFNIISYKPNVSGKNNLEGFVEHRSDQSILSLLGHKYNIEHHRDPSQWGNHMKIQEYRIKNEWLAKDYSTNPMTNSHYETIIKHHRNITFLSKIKSIKWWKKKYLLSKHYLKELIKKS